MSDPRQPGPYGGGNPPWNPYALGPTGLPIGPPPQHPQAVTVLILGVVGIAACAFTAPFAWVMGGRVRREILASHGSVGGQELVTAGWICGIVGTCFLLLGALAFLAWLGFLVTVVAAGS